MASHSSTVTLIDEVSDTVMYIGIANSGDLTSDANWQIKKITKTGDITSIKYADGTADFVNVWDDRASYTYS